MSVSDNPLRQFILLFFPQIWATIFVNIAIITNSESIISMAKPNKNIFIILNFIFFLHTFQFDNTWIISNWKNEWVIPSYQFFHLRGPVDISIATENTSHFGFYNSKSFTLIVALLMKSACFESLFTTWENHFNLFVFFWKKINKFFWLIIINNLRKYWNVIIIRKNFII